MDPAVVSANVVVNRFTITNGTNVIRRRFINARSAERSTAVAHSANGTNVTARVIAEKQKTANKAVFILARWTGFEPAISSVTGRHVNQATPPPQVFLL